MAEEDGEQQQERRRAEAEEMARLQEQINNLPVSEHVLYMMHSLSSLAVDRLGLVPEGAARRDLQQARLAIDAFKALFGVLEEASPTEEMAAHRSVLAQLQLAYVEALGSAVPSDQPIVTEQTSAQVEAEPEPTPEPTPEPSTKAESVPKYAPKKTAKGGSKGGGGKGSGSKSGSAAAQGDTKGS